MAPRSWATGAEEGGHADLCRSMEPRPSSREPHIFANPMATAAAIDRAVHHSVILEFDVPSYRTRVAQQRGQKKGVNGVSGRWGSGKTTVLFEVFSQRYERGSIMVTTNLPFDEWTEVFGSERLTGALLDRITHHVHILEMNGESYRLKRSRENAAAQAPDESDNP